MEAVKTLKTALAAINGTLAKLREELAETNGQLGTVSRRIAELQEMRSTHPQGILIGRDAPRKNVRS